MRLVVDASMLVAEALRVRGRTLLAHPTLDLVLAADTWSETQHELRKRVDLLARHGHLELASANQLLDEALAVIAEGVALAPPNVYANRIEEARRRVPRDPRDAPAVALALVLGCGIWTADYDFFGCGLPVWTTETLRLHLEVEEDT